MKEVFIVGLGGFVGSAMRYLAGLYANKVFSQGFPVGTLSVNLLGSLLIGVLAGYLLKNNNTTISLLMITGFCGGFTTFSAFSLDILKLFQTQHYGYAITYILGSVIGGILLCLLGIFLTNKDLM